MNKITFKLLFIEMECIHDVIKYSVMDKITTKDNNTRLQLATLLGVYKRLCNALSNKKTKYTFSFSMTEYLAFFNYFNALDFIDVLEQVTVRKICDTIHQRLV